MFGTCIGYGSNQFPCFLNISILLFISLRGTSWRVWQRLTWRGCSPASSEAMSEMSFEGAYSEDDFVYDDDNDNETYDFDEQLAASPMRMGSKVRECVGSTRAAAAAGPRCCHASGRSKTMGMCEPCEAPDQALYFLPLEITDEISHPG